MIKNVLEKEYSSVIDKLIDKMQIIELDVKKPLRIENLDSNNLFNVSYNLTFDSFTLLLFLTIVEYSTTQYKNDSKFKSLPIFILKKVLKNLDSNIQSNYFKSINSCVFELHYQSNTSMLQINYENNSDENFNLSDVHVNFDRISKIFTHRIQKCGSFGFIPVIITNMSNDRHYNLIFTEYDKVNNKYFLFHYEPHGANEKSIATTSKFTNFLKLLTSAKNSNFVLKNMTDKCYIGMQSYTSNQDIGYCSVFSLFWLYCTLYITIYQLNKGNYKLSENWFHLVEDHIIRTYKAEDLYKIIVNFGFNLYIEYMNEFGNDHETRSIVNYCRTEAMKIMIYNDKIRPLMSQYFLNYSNLTSKIIDNLKRTNSYYNYTNDFQEKMPLIDILKIMEVQTSIRLIQVKRVLYQKEFDSKIKESEIELFIISAQVYENGEEKLKSIKQSVIEEVIKTTKNRRTAYDNTCKVELSSLFQILYDNYERFIKIDLKLFKKNITSRLSMPMGEKKILLTNPDLKTKIERFSKVLNRDDQKLKILFDSFLEHEIYSNKTSEDVLKLQKEISEKMILNLINQDGQKERIEKFTKILENKDNSYSIYFQEQYQGVVKYINDSLNFIREENKAADDFLTFELLRNKDYIESKEEQNLRLLQNEDQLQDYGRKKYIEEPEEYQSDKEDEKEAEYSDNDFDEKEFEKEFTKLDKEEKKDNRNLNEFLKAENIVGNKEKIVNLDNSQNVFKNELNQLFRKYKYMNHLKHFYPFAQVSDYENLKKWEKQFDEKQKILEKTEHKLLEKIQDQDIDNDLQKELENIFDMKQENLQEELEQAFEEQEDSKNKGEDLGKELEEAFGDLFENESVNIDKEEVPEEVRDDLFETPNEELKRKKRSNLTLVSEETNIIPKKYKKKKKE